MSKLIRNLGILFLVGAMVLPGISSAQTPSAKFVVGDYVQTTVSLNVRANPSTSATILGTQTFGAQGTVVGGPVSAAGYNWWQIDYASGPDGWSVEDYLIKTAMSPAASIPTSTSTTTTPTTPTTPAAPATPAPPQMLDILSSLNDVRRDMTAREITQESIKYYNDYTAAAGTQKQVALDNLEQILTVRKAKMLELAEKSPEEFVSNTLPANVVNSLPQEVKQDVESAATVSGEVEAEISEDLNTGEHNAYYYVDTGTEKVSLFKTDAIQDIDQGDIATFTGYRIDNYLVVESPPSFIQDQQPYSASAQQTTAYPLSSYSAGTAGQIRLAVVLVNFVDSPLAPFSKDEAYNMIFNGSTQKFYNYVSYGKVSLAGNVFGWYSMQKSALRNGKCNDKIDDSIIAGAVKAYGINLNNYDGVITIYNSPDCEGRSGGGTVGKVGIKIDGKRYNIYKSLAIYQNRDKNLKIGNLTWLEFVIAHEFGHNLGVWHANAWECGLTASYSCKHIEYGNSFDVMGFAYLSRSFNAYFKEKFGWLDSSSVLLISRSGRYTIKPLNSDSGVRAAKIKVPGRSDPYYYLEYRTVDTSFDNNPGGSGLHINQVDYMNDGKRRGPHLLDMKPTKDTDYSDWYDVTLDVGMGSFWNSGIKVTIGPVISADQNGITFDITIPGTTPATLTTPTPTSTPTIPHKFSPGDRVQTTQIAEVRDAFGTTILGNQPAGSYGGVMGATPFFIGAPGGWTTGLYYRYPVDFENGQSGWVDERNLVKASGTYAPPALIASKNPSFITPTLSPGAINQKIGSYILTVPANKDIDLYDITIKVGTGGYQFSNLKLFLDGRQFGSARDPSNSQVLFSPTPTPFFTPQHISLSKGSTVTLDEYADVQSFATAGTKTTLTTFAGCSAREGGLSSAGLGISCPAAPGQDVIISAPTSTSITTPVPTPTITVLLPNGGETWKTGETRTISWKFNNYPNLPNQVLVEIVKGNQPVLVIPVAGGATSYTWQVPISLGGDYIARVFDENLASFDDSDALFNIAAPAPATPLSTKFFLNDRVQVTANLNIRASGSVSGALLGIQLSGALGKIIGGPIATGGYTWWQVDYDTGADGWSVGDYLIKSTVSPPTPPAPTPTSTPMSTKFSPGDRVQPTATLNVRAAPSTSGNFLGSQVASTQGTVVGGPVFADGLNWWQIDYASYVDGWSAEDYLVKTQTAIVPSGPSVTIVSQPTAQNGKVTVSAGEQLTISGKPLNITGEELKDFSKAFFFGPIFDSACIGGSNIWELVCFAKQQGVSTFYVEVYIAGKTYRSNTIDVTVSGVNPSPAAVLTPNGGERWIVGSSQTVSWRGSASKYKTELVSFDKTKVWDEGTYGVNSIIWSVGSYVCSPTYECSLPPAGNYFLRISGIRADGLVDSDMSDAPFSIVPATPMSTKFSPGDRVQPTATLNVRAAPSTSGNFLGSQVASTQGTVVGGPVFADGLNWWQIDYASYVDGWSAEDYLTKTTAVSLPTPTLTSTAATTTTSSADTVLPTVTMTAPQNNAVVSGVLTISASASDNVGVVGVRFFLDGLHLGTEVTSPPYSVSWDTNRAASGLHTIFAVARDATGNQNTTASVTVRVEGRLTVTGSPIGLTSGRTKSPVDNLAAITFSADPAGDVAVNQVTITFGGTVPADPTFLVGVNLIDMDGTWLGSGNMSSAGCTGANTCTRTFNLGLTSNGYIITRGTSRTWTLRVDSTKTPAQITSAQTLTASINAKTDIQYTGGIGPGAISGISPAISAPLNLNSVSYGASLLSDTTPPTVSITSLTSGATVAGAVTLSASASDNIGVAGVQFKLDGANLGVEDTLFPYTLSWNTAQSSNGTHTLTATARDAAGNIATSPAVSVIVNNVVAPPPDTTPPTVSILSPQAGATVIGPITISANATDNIGISNVQFFVDGTGLGSLLAASPYSVSWNTVGWSNGSHAITAQARDAAGNSTVSAPVSVTVNNPPPTVAISYTPSAPTDQTGVVLQATASGSNIVKVEFYLDGALQSQCTLLSNYTGSCAVQPAAGTHSFYATATNSGGVAGTSATTNFTVTVSSNDTTPPTVSISSPAQGATVSGVTSISATASDNVGVYGVQFFVDNVNYGSRIITPPYSVSWTTTQYADGQHSIYAIATDMSSNNGYSPIVNISVSNASQSDTTPPTVSASLNSASAPVFTVNASATDPSGIVKIEIYFQPNNGLVKTCTNATTCSATVVLSSGPRTWEVRATDGAGNTATTGPTSFTVASSNSGNEQFLASVSATLQAVARTLEALTRLLGNQ